MSNPTPSPGTGSSFPLHLQGAYSQSTPNPFEASIPSPSQLYQSTHYAPSPSSGVLSPSSAGAGVIQSNPGAIRSGFPHPGFTHSGMNNEGRSGSPLVGSSISGLPPSSVSPPTNLPITSPPPTNAPTPTPPPPQPTPPPPVPTSSRKSTAHPTPASSKAEPLPLLSKEKIEQIAHTVDPNLKLDPDVQEFLQQYAGELVDELAGMSARLAQARKSKVLEVQDVRFYLEHNWNIFIPGFGADPIKAKRKIPETEAHKNRQAIIKKHLKKF